jgi:signal transduction histidine kinase
VAESGARTGEPTALVPVLTAMVGAAASDAALFQLLAQVVDRLPVAVALFDGRDDDFPIVYLNDAASEFVTGPRPGVGRPLAAAFPTSPASGIHKVLRRVRDTGEPASLRGIVTSSGRVWNVDIRALGAADGEPSDYLIAVGQDISEEAASRRPLERLLRSSEALGRPMAPRALAEVAAEQGQRLIEGIECAIALDAAEQPDTLRVVAASGAVMERLVGSTMLRTGSLAALAMTKARPLESDHAPGYGLVAGRLADQALDTVRLVPLDTGGPQADPGRVVGVIGYYRAGHRPFIDTERRLLDEFAKRVSVALHRAQLLETANQTARRLHIGIDVAFDLSGLFDPDEVVSRLVRRATVAADADRATLMSLDGSDAIVIDSFATRGAPSVVGTRRPIADLPILVDAYARGRPAQASSGESPAPGGDPFTEAEHVVVLPLGNHEESVALLGVARQGSPFSEEEVATLQQICTVAALALRSARLFKTRTDFMNMAAHELRTPLSVLTGYVSMLRDGTFGPAPEAWSQPLDVLGEKTNELSLLIDELLTGARLESGSVGVASSLLDLRALVTAAAQRARPRADLLGGSMVTQLPSSAVVVNVDSEHIARVLDNLINNALTYSQPPPWVELTLQVDGDAVLDVADHGRGIHEDFQERVFEQFFRIDDPDFGYPPGTGLGLYISRWLVELAGGTLSVLRSSPGGGSVFRLRLALASNA